jgi:hypothetical protein
MKKPVYVTNVMKFSKTTCDGTYDLLNYKGFVHWGQRDPILHLKKSKKDKNK